MYPVGNLHIPVPHGQLEGIRKAPRGEPKGVAVVLHPHPLHGGTMHNKVVFRAARALNEAALVALRINFRGVGKSTGEHAEGIGEKEDVVAGIDYLVRNYNGLPVTVAGFSFGARVGLEVGLEDDRVEYLIGIGAPVDSYNFDFLKECRKPLLLVHGERDEIGDVKKVKSIAEELSRHAAVKLKIIKGAGHFFEGHLNELREAITTWTIEKHQR